MVDDDAYGDYLGLDQNTLERIMRRPVQMAPRNPRFVRAPVLAAEYIRTSSELQRHSIVNQQRLIREFATANGMTVVRTYSDTPVSGLHAHNRKGFKALLADVMQRCAEYSGSSRSRRGLECLGRAIGLQAVPVHDFAAALCRWRVPRHLRTHFPSRGSPSGAAPSVRALDPR